jgi:DNA-binding beta-propeller fold protein YncE
MNAKNLLLVFVLALLAGSPLLAEEDGSDEEPLFYPAPPQEPRLQFLASFSSVLDVSSGNKGFRDFVFGGKENEGSLVQKPYGVALHDGAIFVVDARGNGWGVYDVANGRSSMVRPSGRGALQKPINMSIDSDGTRFVTDTLRNQVLVYDANDRFLKEFGDEGQFKPVDVVIMDSRLFITDTMHHMIHVLDKQTGESLLTFGEAGSEPGQLYHPTNIALSPDGTVYVSDTTNFRIQEFSADGDFIRAFGAPGTGPGTFSRPKGIAIDRENNIYVVDAAFENVQILHSDGGALMFFGGPGGERDSINMPTVVKIDYDNVKHFQKYAAPNFEIEYLVIVASQFGINRVSVFGFGSLRE